MQMSVLQAEFVAFKAEMAAKVASLEDTIANLAQENALLKRRLFGNRTERSHTSEVQLALGDLFASCRLHGLDPFQYLEDVLRVLPYWPSNRYLELAPTHWRTTRSRLRPEDLAAPLAAFAVPPPLDEAAEMAALAMTA
jgi:hypothetical protein